MSHDTHAGLPPRHRQPSTTTPGATWSARRWWRRATPVWTAWTAAPRSTPTRSATPATSVTTCRRRRRRSSHAASATTCGGGSSGPRPTSSARSALHAAGRAVPLAAETVPAVMKVIPQARRYLEDDATRANTLHRVLAALPETGTDRAAGAQPRHRHRRRPADPAAARARGGRRRSRSARRPVCSGCTGAATAWRCCTTRCRRSRWWLNVWGGADPVTGLRGISHRFPWVLDIDAARRAAPDGELPGLGHGRGPRVGASPVREPGPELSVAESLPEPETDDVELNAYLLLTYAHFVGRAPASCQQARFRGAARGRPVGAHDAARADRPGGTTRPGPAAHPVEVDRAAAVARRGHHQPGRAVRQCDPRVGTPRRPARPRRCG